MNQPAIGASHSEVLPHIHHARTLRPFHWLRLGWEDLRQHPGASLGHGLLIATFGWVILLLTSTDADLLAAAVSGFLLVGPVVGAAFYELSRRRRAREATTFDASLDAAMKGARSLAWLGVILAALALAWAGVSRTLFHTVLDGSPLAITHSALSTVFDARNLDFVLAYLGTGAIFAVAAFVISVISAPMIFHRATSTGSAILASAKAVALNPSAMLVWAALIAVLTAIGFATFLLGLIVILPWIGHATWHAYRDLVD
ncbi:MAG: DUF2189 domain-containing protein [Burkholderiales bacterium]